MPVSDIEAAINKRFGAGAMTRASDPRFVIRRLPTGLLALDVLLNGGFARGRHMEIYGTSNVGKTSIFYNLVATTQLNGGKCSMIDVEGTFDPKFAESQGVDLKELRLTDQSDEGLEHGHKVIDFIEAQLRSREFDVIGLDSIAALLPKSELEDPIEAASMGTEQARLMSKALRKLTAANRHTALIYINQTRQAIGASAFAKQSVTSGGLAMGFYAGTRLEVVRTENIKANGKKYKPTTDEFEKVTNKVVGHRLLVRVAKDKTGSAKMADETSMVYDYRLGGFDYMEDLLTLGRQFDLIKKSSSNWSLREYPEDAKSGRQKFKEWLAADDALCEELHEGILAAAAASRSGDDDNE